jgi:anti-anti-sigma factor
VVETTVCADSHIVCKPLGNLDRAGGISLRHLVRNSLEPGAEIVIDLSRVNFIDSAGMHAVVGTIRLAQALGATTRLTNPRPQVDRLMDLVGVYRLLMRSSATKADGTARTAGT